MGDFDNVAAQMHDAGYYMLSGYDDSYRAFSNNVSGKWVQDGKIVIVQVYRNGLTRQRLF